jgi:hypothetical protein
MNVVYTLLGLKTFSVDALAQRMLELDPNIVPFGHFRFFHGTPIEHYVRNETRTPYKKIIDTEDMFSRYREAPLDLEYLREAEEKYGTPNLMRQFYWDREFNPHVHFEYGIMEYTEEELLRWIQAHIKHMEYVIEECEADIYIDLFTVGFLRHITRMVCRYHKVVWMRPVFTRYQNYAYISDNAIDYWPELEQEYQKLLVDGGRLEDGFGTLEQFKNQNKPANDNLERIQKDFLHAQSIARQFFRICKPTVPWKFLGILKDEINYQKHSKVWKENFRKRRPISYLSGRLDTLLNQYQIKKHRLPKNEFEPDVPYFLFTLCTVPEEATEVRAPFYSNEEFLIETIVKSLPIDCKLYVKEHRTMYYKRPYNFYKRLQMIPRVEVLSPYTDIVELVKGSQGVITVGGTVGFEAIFWGKPLIVFGHALYNFLDFVFDVENITQLPDTLSKARKFKEDKRKTAAFIEAIKGNSFQFSLTLFNNKQPGIAQFWEGQNGEEIKLLARKFVEKLDFFKNKILQAPSVQSFEKIN